ncbi:MAG TPA: SAM-dependent methyltransferase, partial [Armatimonadota bacterium]|nr:SAM-dependent methyltransferase [Armatimonadota bacterium]
MPGTLYVVATPIGNLEDLSPRAARILREVAVVAAEDTRVTRKLLSHFDIHTPLTSCHAHTG